MSIYRRLILPPKKPLAYGKWAIITGTTAGIGEEFANYLANEGMDLLIISRTESKLIEQMKSLSEKYKVKVNYLAYDFTKEGDEKKKFYSSLDAKCKEMDQDGGIGILINNVGTAPYYPMYFDEYTPELIQDLINCNVNSLLGMTHTVFKYMKAKKNGCVISISSGSGNGPTPLLAVYTATK